ncbi:hypothetical protein [Mangrovibacillus cuniculi]|uniref:Uncharacterized protein n=1 Tax=Mangrovibacillus cuniculi TaxID=2593652 RepID=A0A7S8CCD0_9BACI|nr:hypothetical protein [Mangrovibacillus cuniculi]QPC47371.1 hypothetical protein G8O30_10630 [Mangrovibacillus cuniculi]
MSLRENAYDFLHNSLYFYHLASDQEYPEDYKRFWKFALVDLVQSIELIFKELLIRENEFLIYENIDKPKHTVSITTGLNRLKNIVRINFEDKDELILKQAINLRNEIIHFGIELDLKELSTIYTVLFEFLYSFHYRYLDEELHENIHEEYWEEEATLIEQFKNELVIYGGVEISKDYAIEIAESQLFTNFTSRGKEYKRIKFGDEYNWFKQTNCGDCAVKQGYFHALGCDLEECPKCGERVVGCDCNLFEEFNDEE